MDEWYESEWGDVKLSGHCYRHIGDFVCVAGPTGASVSASSGLMVKGRRYPPRWSEMYKTDADGLLTAKRLATKLARKLMRKRSAWKEV